MRPVAVEHPLHEVVAIVGTLEIGRDTYRLSAC